MTFENELSILINRHSKETATGTPDFILAAFMHSCLLAYDSAVVRRDVWSGNITEEPSIGMPLSDLAKYGEHTRDCAHWAWKPTPESLMKGTMNPRGRVLAGKKCDCGWAEIEKGE